MGKHLPMKTLKTLKAQLLAKPVVRAEHDVQAPEFAMARELIAARTRADLTQADVAERMGATRSTVARLEAGKAATAGKEKGTAWVPASVSDWLPDLGSNQGPAD